MQEIRGNTNCRRDYTGKWSPPGPPLWARSPGTITVEDVPVWLGWLRNRETESITEPIQSGDDDLFELTQSQPNKKRPAQFNQAGRSQSQTTSTNTYKSQS
jgi:hypothetical protein